MKKTAFGLGLTTLAAAAAIIVHPSQGPDTASPAGALVSSRAEQVQAAIAPWCAEVPVTMRPGTGGEAGYTTSWHPVFGTLGGTEEYIEIGDSWPDGHPAAEAVALHECAHILQYRAYGYEYGALEADMARVFSDDTDLAVEHMADCMSDLMGADRFGMVNGKGYSAGYGGTCSPEQKAVAAKLVSGQHP